MIILRLELPENKHLLNLENLIERLMRLFPGTMITLDNSYDRRRNAIKKIEEEQHRQGKPFLSKSRMLEELDEHEKRQGPSKDVIIPVNSGTMYFRGYVCVSRIWLSSEDLIDISSIKKLIDIMISLNVGTVYISDNVDEVNNQRLKKLLVD
tara:strand:- start:616 stop:1071 length:456 start_codon:yes stop_codon:yes gene_type:complete